VEALEELVSKPLTPTELSAILAERWLAAMAKYLFQAGFNWKVVEAKWADMEKAFDSFDPVRVAACHNDIDRLSSDKRIIRNGAKVAAVIDNAQFILGLSSEHGGVGGFFGSWPNER